jgi:hypothetical protein
MWYRPVPFAEEARQDLEVDLVDQAALEERGANAKARRSRDSGIKPPSRPQVGNEER